jgi:predicted Zn-dependent protease
MGRKQESEADYIGLMMMAEACYDPRQAVGFWQKMETIQRVGGHEVPEMLSTHPSVRVDHRYRQLFDVEKEIGELILQQNEHRITKIEQWLPEAMKKRMESDCKATSAFADRFREALRKRRPVVIEL